MLPTPIYPGALRVSSDQALVAMHIAKTLAPSAVLWLCQGLEGTTGPSCPCSASQGCLHPAHGPDPHESHTSYQLLPCQQCSRAQSPAPLPWVLWARPTNRPTSQPTLGPSWSPGWCPILDLLWRSPPVLLLAVLEDRAVECKQDF